MRISISKIEKQILFDSSFIPSHPPNFPVFIKLSDHVIQLPDRMLKCGKMESSEKSVFSHPSASRFQNHQKRFRFNKKN